MKWSQETKNRLGKFSPTPQFALFHQLIWKMICPCWRVRKSPQMMPILLLSSSSTLLLQLFFFFSIVVVMVLVAAATNSNYRCSFLLLFCFHCYDYDWSLSLLLAIPNERTLLSIRCSSRHVFLTSQTSEPRVQCRWSPQSPTQWRVRKVSRVTETTGMSLIQMHATSGYQGTWFPPGRLHWTEGWVPFSLGTVWFAYTSTDPISVYTQSKNFPAAWSADFNHRRVCRI